MKQFLSDVDNVTKKCYNIIIILLLLPQLTLEDFMRRTAVERQGRNPQEYAHISRISDDVFRQSGKQKNSRVNWGSNIINFTEVRQNYNEIAELCRKTSEPVFLTKNGEGDLVVMDIESFERREKMLKLREELLSVEEDRAAGKKGYTVKEVASMMRNAIREVKKNNE